MKKQLLLLCLFHSFAFLLNAQTQENNRKCCVVIGCFNTDKDPCKPSRAYEAVPAEMEEISRIKKEFSVKHPFPEVPWGFYPGQYVVVIEYPNKGCNTKGMAFVYSNSKESCLEQIDKSVLEGYYNKDYHIVYQWGDDTYIKARSEYISGVLVDIFTHIKTGKIVKLKFHNKKEKLAKVFMIQPSGDHKRILVPPGDISIGQVFESGTRIKISFDDYNVFDKDKGKKEDWWDIDIIEKLKGEVRKLVTDPNKKNIIVEPCTTMGIRG